LFYDELYRKVPDFFGTEPEPILRRFFSELNPERPVLDLGAGQGRNSAFLAERGFTVHAIEPSGEAAGVLARLASGRRLSIRVYRSSFEEFSPASTPYSGILAFGVIQDLTRELLDVLAERIGAWMSRGGLVMLTAFTTEDPSFALRAAEWKRIAVNSFADAGGNTRTYLEKGEILRLFGGYRVLHHWEGMGPRHRHPGGNVHRHGLAEAVMEKT